MNASIKFYYKIMGVILMLPMCAYTTPTPSLFEFIVSKPFFLNQVGQHAEFVLNISDIRRYELAVETAQEIFPNSVVEKHPFKWKIEVSVWRNGKMLARTVLGDLVAGWPLDGNHKFIGDFSLGVIPGLRSWFFTTKEFRVKVVVLEIDERYTDKNLPARIGIRYSPLI